MRYIKKKTSLFNVLCILILLGGCASNKETESLPDRDAFSSSVDALDELKLIAVEARDELRLLAKAQSARTAAVLTDEQHHQAFFQATYVPPGFEQSTDFYYVGDFEKALEAIALISGYKLMPPEGDKPPGQIWVNIEFKDQPLVHALREIGMQAGDKVLVQVYPAAKIIRYTYAKT